MAFNHYVSTDSKEPTASMHSQIKLDIVSDVPHNREGQSNERALSLNVFVLFLSVIVLFSQHKEFGI